MKARLPVATIIRRAFTRAVSDTTVLRSSNRAASRMTVQPSPSNRSWLSTGAIVSMVLRMCALTPFQSTVAGASVTPYLAASLGACAALAQESNAFEGTQP